MSKYLGFTVLLIISQYCGAVSYLKQKKALQKQFLSAQSDLASEQKRAWNRLYSPGFRDKKKQAAQLKDLETWLSQNTSGHKAKIVSGMSKPRSSVSRPASSVRPATQLPMQQPLTFQGMLQKEYGDVLAWLDFDLGELTKTIEYLDDQRLSNKWVQYFLSQIKKSWIQGSGAKKKVIVPRKKFEHTKEPVEYPGIRETHIVRPCWKVARAHVDILLKNLGKTRTSQKVWDKAVLDAGGKRVRNKKGEVVGLAFPECDKRVAYEKDENGVIIMPNFLTHERSAKEWAETFSVLEKPQSLQAFVLGEQTPFQGNAHWVAVVVQRVNNKITYHIADSSLNFPESRERWFIKKLQSLIESHLG